MSNAVKKRIAVGACSATVFVRGVTVEGEERELYSVQLQRCYKGPDGQFHYTNGLDKRHLPDAIISLQKAYEFLALRQDGQSGPAALPTE